MQQKHNAGFRRLLGALVMLGFSLVLTASMALAENDPSPGKGRVLVDIHGPSMSMGYTLTRWLPSKDDGARLQQVKINGADIVAPVEADSDFTVRVKFSIVNSSSCPDCIAQIVVGFSHQDPTLCVYDSIPGTTVQTGTESFTLRAPRTPGRYFLAFNRTLQFSCAEALANSPRPKPDQYFAIIDVY